MRTPDNPFKPPHQLVDSRLKAVESGAGGVRPETAFSAYDLLPKGAIQRDAWVTNTPLRTATADEDMLLNNVRWKSGRLYGIHLHAIWLMTAGGGIQWNVGLLLNGAIYDYFDTIIPRVLGVVQNTLDSWIYYVPTHDLGTDDIRVRSEEAVNGGDFFFAGNASARRTLTVVDFGKNPGT